MCPAADGFAGDSANEDDDSDGDYMVSVHSVNATVAEQDLHTAGKTDLLQHTMGPMQCASSVECRRPLYNCVLAIQQAGKRLRIAGQEWHKSLAWLRCIFDRVFTACKSVSPSQIIMIATAMIVQCDCHAIEVNLLVQNLSVMVHKSRHSLGVSM